MVIEASKTMAAFAELPQMNSIYREVHEAVLSTDYLTKQGKRIMKAVQHIKDKNKELLVDTFIGKLRYKLPPLYLSNARNEHDRAIQKITAAALVTHILIDNGTLYCEKRAEPVFTAQGKKFYNRLYLVLGCEPEKDMLRGIEFAPGVVYQRENNGWKLNGPEKAFLKKVASIPFCVSEIATKELLIKGYTLKTDWNKTKDKNGRQLPEDRLVRQKRLKGYADVIIDELKPHDSFYLPMKYCGRDRVYYECASLEGMRPHGKLWETLMIDSAVPQELSSNDEKVLKHLIYVVLHGERVSLDEAVARFTTEDLLDAEAIDPMEQMDDESFG